MKTTTKIAIAIAVGIATALTISLNTAISQTQYEKVNVEVEKADILSYRQRAWIGALQWCESRGNPDALNPNDRDNTPSYGILQFKPSTYYSFGKLYGIDTKPGYKDAETQIKIVEQMILRGGINWAQQFPDCTKKLGTPPKISTPKIDKKQ